MLTKLVKFNVISMKSLLNIIEINFVFAYTYTYAYICNVCMQFDIVFKSSVMGYMTIFFILEKYLNTLIERVNTLHCTVHRIMFKQGCARYCIC